MMKYFISYLSFLGLLGACASNVSSPKVIQPVSPPDLTVLYQNMQQKPVLSASEIEDQQRIINRQVETAKSWLLDSSFQRRVAGARQLSAYPIPESEVALSQALQDQNAEVRAAVALSLSYFHTLDKRTLNGLVQALEDNSLTVQKNALHTLSHYLSRQSLSHPDSQMILLSLRTVSNSTLLKEPTRRAILSLLNDLGTS